jgi:hypothetical protein
LSIEDASRERAAQDGRAEHGKKLAPFHLTIPIPGAW